MASKHSPRGIPTSSPDHRSHGCQPWKLSSKSSISLTKKELTIDKTIIANNGNGVEYAGRIPGTKAGMAGFPSTPNWLPISSPSPPGLKGPRLLPLMLRILLVLRFWLEKLCRAERSCVPLAPRNLGWTCSTNVGFRVDPPKEGLKWLRLPDLRELIESNTLRWGVPEGDSLADDGVGFESRAEEAENTSCGDGFAGNEMCEGFLPFDMSSVRRIVVPLIRSETKI